MGYLLTVTPDSFFSVVTVLQLFRMCSVFSLQPQWWFKQWHQWLDPALDFDQSHHTTLSFSLACLPPIVIGHHIKDCGLWFLSWPQNVISGMEKSSVRQAVCSLSLCGVPGVWPAHVSLAHGVTISFKCLGRYASQNKEYNVAFEHFLVSCCSFGVCKFHNTENQNLFSLWLTIV